MYVHGTTHYNLPLTSGEDTRDWFDTNQAFEDVDAALWAAKQDAEGAKEDLTGVKDDVATLQTEAASEKTRLDTAISDITAVSTVVIQQGTDISNTKQDLEDMVCPTQESSATASVEHAEGSYFIYNDTLYKADELITVGTLIVPDSNCHTTSVTDNLGGGGGGGAVIDDTTTSTSTVWSSSKTNTEVTKARVGDTRYSSGKLQYYNGSTWVDISIGGGSMMLNYSNIQSIDGTQGSTGITASADGEFWFTTKGNLGGNAVVSINGAEAFTFYIGDVAYQTRFPIKSGDRITFTGGNNANFQLYFAPYAS